MTTIYFGEIDQEVYPDTEDTFEWNNSRYWYRAEIRKDDVCFYDTCGRHFPIDLENCGNLLKVLCIANRVHEQKLEVEKLKNQHQKEIEEFVKDISN